MGKNVTSNTHPDVNTMPWFKSDLVGNVWLHFPPQYFFSHSFAAKYISYVIIYNTGVRDVNKSRQI